MLYEITKISLFVLVTKRRKDWAASLQFCLVTKVKSNFNSPAMHMLIYILYRSFQHLHLFFYLSAGLFNYHFNSKLGFESFILQYVWISTYITESNESCVLNVNAKANNPLKKTFRRHIFIFRLTARIHHSYRKLYKHIKKKIEQKNIIFLDKKRKELISAGYPCAF